MPALQWTEYGYIKRQVWNLNKPEIRALTPLPPKASWLAGFQAIEDFWETNRATLKGNIDTAMGITTTSVLARTIGLAWLVWKVSRGG